jgi:hypothetical protein
MRSCFRADMAGSIGSLNRCTMVLSSEMVHRCGSVDFKSTASYFCFSSLIYLFFFISFSNLLFSLFSIIDLFTICRASPLAWQPSAHTNTPAVQREPLESRCVAVSFFHCRTHLGSVAACLCFFASSSKNISKVSPNTPSVVFRSPRMVTVSPVADTFPYADCPRMPTRIWAFF